MRKNKVLAIVAIVLFIGILLLVGFSIEKLNSQIIEQHSFYQYFAGQKYEYEGGFKLSRKNEITELVTNDVQVNLDSTPVYYIDIPDKVLLPEDMAIVFPTRVGMMYKINHFSNIYYDINTAYLEEEQADKALNNSFLFDGEDLYFFLTEETLTVGEDVYNLSPLSYVICTQNTVEIYQKDEDKYTIKENIESVTASATDYTINLNTDSILTEETEQLLIKNITTLKNFE